MIDRLTIRLGTLAGPLERRVLKLRITPSEYVRKVLAADLGVVLPVMRPGPVCGISKRVVRYKK